MAVEKQISKYKKTSSCNFSMSLIANILVWFHLLDVADEILTFYFLESIALRFFRFLPFSIK
jgi:hypothetical protein